MTQTVLLGDIAYVTKLAGYEFTKHITYDDSGEIIALRALNLRDGRLDLSNVKRISREISEKLPRSKLSGGDILLSYTGTVGNFAMVEDDNTFHLAPNVCLIRANDNCLPEYLYYIIADPSFKQQLLENAHGSTQATVPMKNIRNLKVSLPSIDEQEKTVGQLRPIDEKIELNRKMNETLEQMGQALFCHYFIDNPEAEKWGIVTISELCEKVASGGTPATKREDYYGGDVQWYSTKELKDGFLFGSEKTITDEGLSNSAAKLFPENTVMMAIYAAPTVGRLGILTSEASFNQATCGLVAKPDIGYEFIYLYLLLSRAELNNMANGAAQQNISVGKVRDFKVMKPNDGTISDFRKKIEPIFAQIRNNSEQIQTLTTLRDTLLPRLINGKVKV